MNRLHPVQESLIRDERWNTIDLYAATANRRQLYDADGVHFNDDGYRFLAEQIAGVMHRSAQIIGSTGRERVIANETENGATKRAGVGSALPRRVPPPGTPAIRPMATGNGMPCAAPMPSWPS